MQTEKLSIIVAFRERDEHLKMFIPHMQKYLSDIPHDIFVIEQYDKRPFNRGKLMNIGFLETEKTHDYSCFHDVDMLPQNADYSYTDIAHLASRAEQFEYKMPYSSYFGGVTMFSNEKFRNINGYSNNYWGWGAEDDDLLLRCFENGLHCTRREGVYTSLDHERNIDHKKYDTNVYLLDTQTKNNTRKKIMKIDGLNSCNYTIVEKSSKQDYELIRVLV